MLGNVGRRAVDVGVGLFALLGFFFVPLGRHTAFEHVKAIVATGPASELGHELMEAAGRVKHTLIDAVTARAPRAEPVPVPAPSDPSARPVAQPPKLPHGRHVPGMSRDVWTESDEAPDASVTPTPGA